jgi:hypothetical protein
MGRESTSMVERDLRAMMFFEVMDATLLHLLLYHEKFANIYYFMSFVNKYTMRKHAS